MRILSIETSCDETAVSLVEANGGLTGPHFSILGNALFSQIEIHKEYGGVYPNLAKREHAKKFPILLKKVLEESDQYKESNKKKPQEIWEEIKKITEREGDLYENLKDVLENISRPEIDVIAVTSGPGLEPALWVGISCAKAIGKLWDIPVIPVNHMEGHITSVLLNKTEEFSISNFQFLKENPDAKIHKPNTIQFPALALLISGGHTELVKIDDWGKYKIIGQTKDDAVGEAFDKVARTLGLPYPGGPEISKLAQKARIENIEKKCSLPRPMINSNNFDFSFSGLKTAVLYYVKNHSPISENDKCDIAREFEDSAIEVLLSKTKKVLDDQDIKTLIIAGGVVANKKLREEFNKLKNNYQNLIIKIPEISNSTDNALMIATASYIQIILDPEITEKQNEIIANGNLKLEKTS